jgi:hypothetical protein
LLLIPDEWMDRIVGDGYNDEKRAVVETMQWEIAEKVLKLGVDVIWEGGKKGWQGEDIRVFSVLPWGVVGYGNM